MKTLIVLSILIVLCAAKNLPPVKISNYVDDYKQLITNLKNNLTDLGNFTLELNNNIRDFLQTPKLSGTIEKTEKLLLEKYDINKEGIKKCIQEKNSEIEKLSLKISNKKDGCKLNSKILVKQIQNEFSKITDIGEHTITSISLEINKCLKNCDEDEDKCLKCLSEKRKPMNDKTNMFYNKFENLIGDSVPALEYSIGLMSICVSETQRYIKTSEKSIAHNLEECFLKTNY